MVSSGYNDALRQRSCSSVKAAANDLTLQKIQHEATKSQASSKGNKSHPTRDQEIDEAFHVIRREIYRDYLLGSCEIMRRGVKPGRLLDAVEYRRSLASSYRRHHSSRRYPKTERQNQQIFQVLDYSPYNQQVCGLRLKEKSTLNNAFRTSRYAKYFSLNRQMDRSRPRRLVVKEMLQFNFESRKKVDIPGCKWMVPKPELSHSNARRCRSKTPHSKKRSQTRQSNTTASENIYEEESFLNCSKKKSAIDKWLSKIEDDLVLENIPSPGHSLLVEKSHTYQTEATLENQGNSATLANGTNHGDARIVQPNFVNVLVVKIN